MRIWPPIVTSMLGGVENAATAISRARCAAMRERGGVPGHHVKARTRRSRALVKAVSPAARGRSEAESLDEGEASPRITGVRAGQMGRAGRFAIRRQSSALRGLCAFESHLLLAQRMREPPLMFDERKE